MSNRIELDAQDQGAVPHAPGRPDPTGSGTEPAGSRHRRRLDGSHIAYVWPKGMCTSLWDGQRVAGENIARCSSTVQAGWAAKVESTQTLCSKLTG